MKKIIFFLPNLEGGGAQRVVLNLAKAFADKGDDVILIVAIRSGKLLDQVPTNVKLVHLELMRSAKAVWPLAKIIRAEKPDIVFSRMNYANIITSMACIISLTKAKVILTIATTLSQNKKKGLFKNGSGILFGSLANIRANAVVANSTDTYNDLVEANFAPRHKLKLIYNPVVDLKTIEQKMLDPIDHSWLIDKTHPVIISVGRLSKPKNFSLLLKAFKEVSTIMEAKLIILGEGELKGELEKLSHDLGVTEDVSFYGFVKNPYPYYKRADLFVLTSLWEGFGNVVAEAMACGCPVLVNDCPGGPKEIVNFGEFGTVLEGFDVNVLANAICAELASKRDSQKLVSRAKDYSIDKIVTEYEELFSSL